MKKMILASASPRRKELLELVGLEFEVHPSDCDEDIREADPAEYAVKLSEMKAKNVADATGEDCYVVGADTIVVCDEKILGKPRNEEEAFAMLKGLSGRVHSVYTGVTIIDTKDKRVKSFYEKTDVEMYDVCDEEIQEYIATGDPFDKAGGYGAQSKGAFLVKGIKGDFYNVVGLPVARLVRELKNF